MHQPEDVANMQNSNAQLELTERFFRAASDGETSAIQNMVGFFRSVSIDQRNKQGWTALMLAARNGHTETVNYILEQGADACLINKIGQNATEIASFWNHKGVVKNINQFLKPACSPRLEFVNHFGTNNVDRQSYKRKDIDYIESLKSLESTRYVIFADLQLLVTTNTSGKTGINFLSFNQINILNQKKFDTIYLGIGCLEKDELLAQPELMEVAYFAMNYKEVPTDDNFPIAQLGGEFTGHGYAPKLMGLRSEESGLVAQARSILSWHDRYMYCPTCGSETKIAESGYKRTCLDLECRSHKGVHNTCFPRIDPVVIVLVVSQDGTKCLLGRQSRFPPRTYSCLAGFMEPGETIEDAARREILEESGIKVGKLEYHSSQPWPFPGQLMIGFIGHAISNDITVDHEELEDAKWFSRAEVAEALAGGFEKPKGLLVPPKHAIAHQLQKAWVKMSSNL